MNLTKADLLTKDQPALISMRGIVKRFGDFTALEDVSLRFDQGELVALLGPSGCGKTTLLRIIAGLTGADSGEVLFDGSDASTRQAGERQVGFVFQHYALFRHMSVFDNIAFGLEVKPRSQRPARAEISRRVHALLQLVQLDWLADRFPSQLSGGQRQRIALARALAVEPKILLLDEPFGALDAKVRKELRAWLRNLHDEMHVTTVIVTHDQEEAMEVSNRIVIFSRGRLEQIGTPREVYEEPVNEFVARFIGVLNVLDLKVTQGVARLHELAFPADGAPEGSTVRIGFRPYAVQVSPDVHEHPWRAVISHTFFLGVMLRIDTEGGASWTLMPTPCPVPCA